MEERSKRKGCSFKAAVPTTVTIWQFDKVHRLKKIVIKTGNPMAILENKK